MIHKNNNNARREAPEKPRRGALGNNAKSFSPPEEKTEEIRFNRSERYRLLSQARTLLFNEGKKAGLAYPANYHQTAKCIHTRLGDNVQLYQSNEHKKAFFGGVVQCGRVFTCPVCAAKVQERRRIEIAKAFDYAYDQGKKVIMITITFPHQRTQHLKDLLRMQSESLARLRSGKAWQNRKKGVGYTGLIRSLEITHSDRNGWHPHTHEAWIVDKTVNVETFREWLANRWHSVCIKSGLLTEEYEKTEYFLEHSIQITDNCSNSDYLAKLDDSKHWGADAELAKSSVKQAKGKGVHPYEFLSLSMAGDKQAGRRFIEYADAMRGKAQIFWSRGLKKLVNVEELTDEEIAAKIEDAADLLGHLDVNDWRVIKTANAQAFVLDIAERSGMIGVRTFIEDCQVLLTPDDTAEVPTEIRVIRTRLSKKMREQGSEIITEIVRTEQGRAKYWAEFDARQKQNRELILQNTLAHIWELFPQ